VALVAQQDVLWAAALFAVVAVRHQPNVRRWLQARRDRPPLGT
jgi:hypothetical protein